MDLLYKGRWPAQLGWGLLGWVQVRVVHVEVTCREIFVVFTSPRRGGQRVDTQAGLWPLVPPQGAPRPWAWPGPVRARGPGQWQPPS